MQNEIFEYLQTIETEVPSLVHAGVNRRGNVLFLNVNWPDENFHASMPFDNDVELTVMALTFFWKELARKAGLKVWTLRVWNAFCPNDEGVLMNTKLSWQQAVELQDANQGAGVICSIEFIPPAKGY
jgi:hypothetical protein